MSERDVTTRDGRTLRVSEDGDPDGTPVIMLHGQPGSRLLEPTDVARARRRGIRLISYDRPGYGGSTRHEGRNIADGAGDVRAIADHLGIRRLAVWGISGGGPHAAACAALLEGLVPAVGVLASMAPWGAPRLDYLAGMGEANVDDIKQFLADRTAAYEKVQRDEETLLAGDAATLREVMQTLLAPVDAEVLTGELAEFLVANTKLGLAPRHDGWWDDGVAGMSDWGFGLTQIKTPVLLMHGRHDRFVPFAHGEWLAASIPGVEPRLYEDEGHLSLLVDRLDELYDWLLAHMD